MTVVTGIQPTRNTGCMVAEFAAGRGIEILCMAKETIIGKSAEHTAWMAVTTFDKTVRPGESKARFRV